MDSLKQAINLHQAGRLQQAEDGYRKILQENPKHCDALHLLGVITHQRGDHDTAASLIQKAISCSPGNPTFYFNLASVYKAQGNLEQAVTAYRNVIRINPAAVEAFNNLGVMLKDMGQLKEAAQAFQQALKIQPGFAVAAFNLGNVYFSLKRNNDAIQAYQQALSIKPDYADAWFNLGNVYLADGLNEQAITSYKKTVQARQDFAEAYFSLGKTYQATDRFDEAIANYTNAILYKPAYIEAYIKLGNTYSDIGHYAEARENYHQALHLHPESTDALYGIARSLIDEGKFTEANTILRRILSLNPGHAKSYHSLTSTKIFTSADDDIQAMEHLLQDNGLSAEDKILINFSLAKAFEDIHMYDKSFHFLQAGNNLKRKTFDYDIAGIKSFFSSIKDIFSRKYFSHRNEYGGDNKMPIFIIGMPRSGTTLVEQILASHPAVSGAGELTDLKRIIFNTSPKLTYDNFPENAVSLDAGDIERFASEYIRCLNSHKRDATYVTDKMPGNFLYIGLIKLMFPQARVIHCVRDPIDTCLSIYKQLFVGIHRYAYNLEELGHYYCYYLGLMEHWRNTLPQFIFNIHYEELVSDQEVQTRRLLDHCELPWDDACLSFHRSNRPVKTASLAQVKQPIYRGSIDKWRHYEQHLEPLLRILKAGSNTT